MAYIDPGTGSMLVQMALAGLLVRCSISGSCVWQPSTGSVA